MPASRTRSLGLVGLGIVASGLLANVYLAIIARSVPAADYAYFGAFWSLVLLAGFGVFLPVEQETARLLQTAGRRPLGVIRAALLTSASMAIAQLALLAVSWPLLVDAFGGHSMTVVALGVICLVSAGQFVVRGALIGMDRMGRHALIMLFDSVLRVTFAAIVAVVVAEPGSAEFAWTLVVAMALAHAPQLLSLLRKRTRATTEPDPTLGYLGSRAVASAVAPLLLGSLCAQLLLNGPPIIVPALAQAGVEATQAGQFVAAYTLARIPLFLVVPLQSALLPLLAGVLDGAQPGTVVTMLRRTTAGLVVLAVAALLIGYFAGPWLVALVFGPAYVLEGWHVALLAVGVAAYIGLVLLTQVMVAAVRHAMVAWSWLSAVVVGVVVVILVPDLLLRVELGFLIGSATGWLVATVLVRIGGRARELQEVH